MTEVIGRFFKYLLVFVLGAGGLVMALSHDRLHVYQSALRETSPQITMRYEQLSVDMDEAAARRHFAGVNLDCFGQPKEANGLGDRVCYAPIDAVDGNAALTLALFFNKGRLSVAVVHVPWWRHVGMRKRLLARYGEPGSGGVTDKDTPILRWKLPNGDLDFVRDRDLNPLNWSGVVWLGKDRSR